MTESKRPPRPLSPDDQTRLRDRLAAGRRASVSSAIPPRAPGARLPVSHAQQQFWLLDQLERGGNYGVTMSLPLVGPLQVAQLEAAIGAIVGRHEILRTTLVSDDSGIWQAVADPSPFLLVVDDLFDGGADGAAIGAIRTNEAERPFDLAHGPLFRARLLRLGATAHELLLSFHHSITDGWSLGVFLRELVAWYGAFAAGTPALVPDLAVQYGDYAIWQRRALQGPAFDRHLEFWRRYLAGSEPTMIPADRVRSRTEIRQGARLRATLSALAAAALRRVARGSNATLYQALLAAFNVVVFRTGGQTDQVIGTPVANRPLAELEPLIGCFVNAAMVRTRLAATATFRETLALVREASLAAFEHQHVPFERLVEELAPAREVSRNPLFQIGFNVLSGDAAPLETTGVRFGPFRGVAETTRFDLEVHVSEIGDRLEISFLYRSDLYDAGTIERLLAQYIRVLEQVAEDPDRRLDDVTLLSSEERRELMAGGRGESSAYPREATLRSLLEAQIRTHATRIAVEDATRSWTYAQLGSAARRLAGELRELGAGRDAPVGVWVERDGRLPVSIAGIAIAEAAYVPAEIHEPGARAAAMWTETGVTAVVTTADLVESVPAGPWRVLTLESTEERSDDPLPLLGTARDPAYVLYTSGSTGRPKGVAVPQRSIVRLVCATDYVDLTPDTTMAQAASAAFDAATFEIWGALLHGGRLVVVPTATVIDPVAFGAHLRRTGVTTVFLTTALLHQIGREAPGSLAGVDTVLFGGEAVVPRWVAAILDAGGPRRLLHVYGPTENTTFSTWFHVSHVTADAVTIPIGGPIAHSDAYVLAPGGSLAPLGAEGELFLGGDGLAQGYVAAPRQTAERFVPDHVSGALGGRLYRTGDIVRWRDAGALEFVGRRDGQVKLRGHRIELGEIEAALRALPGVGMTSVLIAGGGLDQRLVAYVAPTGRQPLEGRSLRETLKSRLPGYMVPAAVYVLANLPLNANGKVDRAALLGAARREPATAAPSVAPRSRLEEQIVATWREVLDVDAVGPDDNFFDLGGHSLLLVRVQTALVRLLGRPVPLVTLFEHPTAAALARHLTGVTPDQPAPMPGPEASEPIAIIGLAGFFPGAPDLESFWQHLAAGHELIRRFTRDELELAGVPAALIADPQFVPARGALDHIDRFDAGLFGYAPREAALIDPQQRLLLETAWTALEHAGYAPGTERSGAVGVFVGTSANSYIGAAGPGALEGVAPLQVLLASDKDFLATRVSYKLRLTGPAVTVQTACSTSLVAVHAACQAIRAGECAMALAGGVSVTVPAVGGYRYHEEGISSPDGHCRTFDARAAGTVPGNGAGIVVLKRLGSAIEDGDCIHAVILGTAINNDGADKVGFTAPSVRGQAAVIRSALTRAGVAASSLGYVEAHGTGTTMGDPIEVAALRQVFGDGAGPATCALGSVKTNVGHLDAAAGVTGLIKTVLALEHRALPASLHFESPSPQIAFGPFYVPTVARPWTPPSGLPRRAGVSSFGMGGTNAHVVVEEAPLPRGSEHSARRWHVVPVSGQTMAAASESCEALAGYLDSHPDVALADVAFTQQVGRASLAVRRVAVGAELSSIVESLRAAREVKTTSSGRRALVWMFPGQGAHARLTGRGLYDSEPAFAAEIDACAAALRGHLDEDLRTVLYPTPESAPGADELADTMWTQVTLVAVELALAAVWRSWGIVPDAVMGHSVGELAAACVAGVISREDAMRLTAVRGRLMRAAPAGGMVAIAAPPSVVEHSIGAGVWLAAVNAPNQCVVAGTEEALATLAREMAVRGIGTTRLPAAGAFHSGLMSAVSEPLTAAARRMDSSAPQIPWISSVGASRMTDTLATAAEYWGEQVVSCVRWSDAIEAARREVSRDVAWLEVGPGHTLTQLGRFSAAETDERIASMPAADPLASMARALGALWAAGITPEWRALHEAGSRQIVPLPTYPFQRQRYWLDPRPSATEAPVTMESVMETDVRRWCYVPSWTRVPIAPRADASADHCVIVVDSLATPAIAAGLRMELESLGALVTTVEAGATSAPTVEGLSVDANSAEGYRRVLAALGTGPRRPTKILHALAVSDKPPGAESPSVELDLRRGIYSLTALVQALAGDTGLTPELIVLANGTASVRGDEPLSAARAAILGFCRVIPQEHPHLAVRVIDLECSREGRPGLPGGLAADILSGGDERVVAWRGNRRWSERFERVPAAAAPAPSRIVEGGTYLITGGLGRIGLTLARYLGRSARARLVLISRTALPPRAEWPARIMSVDTADGMAATLRALIDIESEGGTVWPEAADVSDPDALRAAIARGEASLGTIRGVVHAAGATSAADFAAIVDLDHAAWQRQLQAKVHGTIALADALEGRSLDFCVLASSLSSVVGGLGFAAYAAANAFMNAFAEAMARPAQKWMSLSLDGWAFGETVNPAATIADPFRPAPATPHGMKPEEGLEAFLHALNLSNEGHVVISIADLQARGPRRARATTAVGTGTGSDAPRPELRTPFAAPATDLEEQLCASWQQALGIDRLGRDDNFFELGGDSLMAIHLLTKLQTVLNVKLSLNDLWQDPTVAQLARRIETLQRTAGAAHDQLARALEAIHQLSDADVDRLLAE